MFHTLIVTLAVFAPPADNDQTKEINRLVEQLGSARFQERESAARALEKIGDPALEALRRASASGRDAELRRRAGELLELIRARRVQGIRRFDGHRGMVRCLAFSPDGRFLLSGGNDGTARLWDVETGKEVRQLEGHSERVQAVAWSGDGRRILTASGDILRLWDAQTGKELQRFKGHTHNVTQLAFASNGQRVVSAGQDHTVRTWDAESGKQLSQWRGWEQFSCAAFLDDGRSILSVEQKGQRLYEVESGKVLGRFDVASPHAFRLACAADGNRFLFLSREPTVTGEHPTSALHLWDMKKNRLLFESPGRPAMSAIALSPDGRWALSGGGSYFSANRELKLMNAAVAVWDMETGKLVANLADQPSAVSCVAFAPDSRRAVYGRYDGAIGLIAIPE